jgi:hypothetical protein
MSQPELTNDLSASAISCRPFGEYTKDIASVSRLYKTTFWGIPGLGGLNIFRTLAITWPPRFVGLYRYYLEAAQVNGIVGHHDIAGPPTLALPTHAISSVSSIPR